MEGAWGTRNGSGSSHNLLLVDDPALLGSRVSEWPSGNISMWLAHFSFIYGTREGEREREPSGPHRSQFVAYIGRNGYLWLAG